ncbi:ABC-type multidrug transport system, ATPase and permease component [Butyrivibrio sp. Su6]|uniref:ABC transporter ATP-binding protein n=1 Tax=Butyrivibrio sp. Su6 TaxID=1520810 RepID=UPI00089E3862|nr:ABC transporter ATP-binding protein [Butyrivibrio sp. Su6]SEG15905.1 ABC-type multidrug transport system, ATPase and permease component [Butyrivibrio sp. Su6]
MKNDITKFLNIIREVFEILDKEDRKKSYVVLADILLCAVLETIGVSLIVPFMTLISSPESITEKKVINSVVCALNISSTQLVLIFGLFLCAFYLAKNFFLMYSSYLQNKFRYGLHKKLSVRMLGAYMQRPYEFFVETNSSEIVRGVGSDIGCVKDALGTLFDLVTQVLTLILIAIFLAYTDLTMAACLLFISLLCMFFLVYVLRIKISNLGKEQREAETKITKYFFEMLEGIKEILAMRKEKSFMAVYEKECEEKGRVEAKYMTYLSFPNRVIETIFMVGIIVIIAIRILQGVEVSSFVPQLAAFAVGGIKMLPAMSVISKSVTAVVYLKPGVDAVYSNMALLDASSNILDLNETVSNEKFETLEIDDIHWKFNGADHETIKGLSLKINKGESVAIIGTSGAGKTTLIDIILGLFTPQIGAVKVNGKDISRDKHSWCHMFTYVQQNIFIMDDSLKKNIAFGISESDIDEAKVYDAIKQAQLYDFVSQLDDGINTIVGERGVKFSGGQRQRVAIARALYFDSDVIIFDEATAALDVETEKALISSIEALHGEKTMIIVAHRLSTVANCDKIYEIKDGRTVERTKESLFKRD